MEMWNAERAVEKKLCKGGKRKIITNMKVKIPRTTTNPRNWMNKKNHPEYVRWECWPVSWLELKARKLIRRKRTKTISWCKTWCWDKLARLHGKTMFFFDKTKLLLLVESWKQKLGDSHKTNTGFNDDKRRRIDINNLILLVATPMHFASQRQWLTFLPAWLLCKFISLRASPSISRTSRNFRANRMPKSMSTEHPPHFHDCF